MNAIRKRLTERLKGPLPGPEIWKHWTSRTDPYFQPPAHAKQAGVLICLYQQKGDLYLPVMMRPSRSGPHSGQISLPGGAFEACCDTSIIDTALREAEEEMGIRDVAIIGTLSSLYIPVSDFLVQPVIGTVDTAPQFRPDPTEVERIIEVPVDELLDRRNHGTHTFHNEGRTIRARAFRVAGEIIWGATAMILAEFLHVYEQSNLSKN